MNNLDQEIQSLPTTGLYPIVFVLVVCSSKIISWVSIRVLFCTRIFLIATLLSCSEVCYFVNLEYS